MVVLVLWLSIKCDLRTGVVSVLSARSANACLAGLGAEEVIG